MAQDVHAETQMRIAVVTWGDRGGSADAWMTSPTKSRRRTKLLASRSGGYDPATRISINHRAPLSTMHLRHAPSTTSR